MSRSDDLVEALTSLGVEIRRVYGDEINAKCPVHFSVKGRHSSRFSWYMNYDTGLWHCFTCGARGNLSMLVSDLAGDPSVLWGVQKHLITSGLRRLTSDEQEVAEAHAPIDWGEYSKFSPLPSSVVTKRELDPGVANRYGIKWDKDKKAVVIPIVSPIGELWGWQLKKTGWVRNHPVGVHKGDTLFGIERAYTPSCILLESPLDVARFHSVYDASEYSAVASFGANVSATQIRVLADRFDRIVVALDNDKAGKMETKRLSTSLPSFRRGIKYWKYAEDSPKDLGEMSELQIIKGLSQVTSLYV